MASKSSAADPKYSRKPCAPISIMSAKLAARTTSKSSSVRFRDSGSPGEIRVRNARYFVAVHVQNAGVQSESPPPQETRARKHPVTRSYRDVLAERRRDHEFDSGWSPGFVRDVW